jgi:hypothetical protein
MPRARNIKPGFFSNDKLSEIQPLGRLLFAGLWTIADRAGRLEDRPKKIKAEVLPYDNCNVDRLLNDLQERGFILRYSTEGQAYIQIIKFDKHQNPHKKEAESTLPAPGEHCACTVQDPTQYGTDRADSGFLIPDSLNLIPDKPARKRALPVDFGISDRVRQWASEREFGSLEAHLEHFVGWAKAGGKTYVDWDQCFMNAIRDDWAKVRGNTVATPDYSSLVEKLAAKEKADAGV